MQLSYDLSLPHDSRYVSVVRRLAVTTLTELDVEPSCVDDIALAVTEACSNVVQHGHDGGDFDVRIAIDGTSCRITVRDTGDPFEVDLPSTHADGATDASSVDADGVPRTHGRGIALMQLLVDQLRYVPDESGTTVELIKEMELRPGSVLARS